jgi:hypothetical protein
MKIKQAEEKSVDMPHNGSILKAYIKGHKLIQADVAREMGVLPSSLLGYYAHSSLQLRIWWKASLALKHNFIAELGEQHPVEFIFPHKDDEVEKLRKEVEKLRMEVAIYKKILKVE